VGESSFITKAFPPTKFTNYERERAILTQLNHPHIIKPIDFSHALVSKLASSVINAFILFPEYPKGDLLAYIKANGTLSERVARFYTKQIV
jgi:serine/threonine protein kinase